MNSLLFHPLNKSISGDPFVQNIYCNISSLALEEIVFWEFQQFLSFEANNRLHLREGDEWSLGSLSARS